VITASFTWPATVNAIIHAGATPVMVDVEPRALTLEPGAVEAALTPRTRALLPVHFAGAPCDIDALEQIARSRDLVLVEDAAHAVETTAGARKVGSIGDFTCFSLYATKSLSGGEGGVVTTASDAAAERLRVLRSHGITRDPWRRRQTGALGTYDVVYPGYKANLADLQASVVLPKLAAIDRYHAHRTALAARYDAGIADLAGIEPLDRPARGRHAHHLYVVRIDPEQAGADRGRYAAALQAENVSSGIHFLPVHTLTWYSEHLQTGRLPVTERAGAEVLSLPLAAAHSTDDIDDAVAALRKVHGVLAPS
jgi:dTDP-4-amino-4,6-dideoxygalactose transaminase